MKQVINWKEFNALKQEAFSTKTEQEWETVKARYMEMVDFYEGETRQTFKEKTVPQLQALYEKKKAYWDKQKQHPIIQKNNFIFREEEGEAFTRLCNALADLLEKQTYSAALLPPTIDFLSLGGTSVHAEKNKGKK